MRRGGTGGEPAAANFNLSSVVSKNDREAEEVLVDYEPEEPTSMDLAPHAEEYVCPPGPHTCL